MHRWILALSFAAASAHAQTSTATIDPGMTRAQVIERLGKPATVRTYQGSTYLMYSNKCGKKCGMQDIVILDHDVVVDAVFRSPDRHYTGTSSSPDATAPNSRTQRNQSLAVPPAQPTAAERVLPGTTHVPADSANTSTSHVPHDSARTSTSDPPHDSARTSTSYPPHDSARTSTSYPPHDSARTSTSVPPHDSSRTSTSYPPADSAPIRPATTPVPYGKPSPTPPPADNSTSQMSHPPADNANSGTSHPPKPPK
jgi:hypothetical protein